MNVDTLTIRDSSKRSLVKANIVGNGCNEKTEYVPEKVAPAKSFTQKEFSEIFLNDEMHRIKCWKLIQTLK